jgi:hypothetical protein
LSNQKYGVTFYSLGGKKYKQVNKFRFYHQRENEEIFVIRNDIGGSLVYEGLFRIKNLENHINWLKQNKGYYSEEKNTLVYGEKGIGGTAYNYIKHNKKIKEFIFKKNGIFFTYVVHISKQSATAKYNINRYLEQSLEGLDLK